MFRLRNKNIEFLTNKKCNLLLKYFKYEYLDLPCFLCNFSTPKIHPTGAKKHFIDFLKNIKKDN